MSVEWDQEAAAAGNRSVVARAEAHGESANAQSCLARAEEAAALRTVGEPEFWALRAKLHDLRRHQLEEESELEAEIERHARSYLSS